MKKRWMVLGLLLVVLGTAAVFLSWNRGDVRHVQRFVGDSLVYTEEEVRDFSMKEDEMLVQMNRWMYFQGIEKPVNFVIFRVPSHVLEYPFLG